jgi:hypothetical protein
MILLVGICATVCGNGAYRAYNDPSEPSPEAQKLIDSLESDIDRWSNWVVTRDETHSHLSGPGGVKIYPGLFLPRVTTAADKRIDFRFNDLCHINRARRTAIAKLKERSRANALTALDRKEEGPVEPTVSETAENIAISLRDGKSWQTVTLDKEVYLMSTSWDITVDSNGDVETVGGRKNYHTALVLQKMLKSTDRPYLACAYRLRLRDICAAALAPKDTRVVEEKTPADKALPVTPPSPSKLFETFDAPEAVTPTPAVIPMVPMATPSYSSYYAPARPITPVSYSTDRQWLETRPSTRVSVR